VKVGVLAIQGAFAAHAAVLESIGVAPVEVRRPAHLEGLDGLVLPGGESTTLSMGLDRAGLTDPLRAFVGSGAPVLGTCAGAILLATQCLDGRSDQVQIGALDVVVRRNAFGRQVDSFEVDLEFPALAAGAPPGRSAAPFHGVFIRAPAVEEVGPSVEVLARLEGTPVAVACGSVVATTFHPELAADPRVHEFVLGRSPAGRR